MKRRAIWHVPLLVAAGLTAIVGVVLAFAVSRTALPSPWGHAIPSAFAGASLTFTTARIIHARAVGQRELELLALGIAVLVADFYAFAAAVVIGLSLLGLIGSARSRA
jgi:hypothetical protein